MSFTIKLLLPEVEIARSEFCVEEEDVVGDANTRNQEATKNLVAVVWQHSDTILEYSQYDYELIFLSIISTIEVFIAICPTIQKYKELVLICLTNPKLIQLAKLIVQD